MNDKRTETQGTTMSRKDRNARGDLGTAMRRSDPVSTGRSAVVADEVVLVLAGELLERFALGLGDCGREEEGVSSGRASVYEGVRRTEEGRKDASHHEERENPFRRKQGQLRGRERREGEEEDALEDVLDEGVLAAAVLELERDDLSDDGTKLARGSCRRARREEEEGDRASAGRST